METKFKVGDTVRIDGIIEYGQDGMFWEGGFSEHLIWRIDGLFHEHGIYLKASGYGNISKNIYDGIYVSKKWYKNLTLVSKAEKDISDNIQLIKQLKKENIELKTQIRNLGKILDKVKHAVV
jgi:hypothetical protein